MNNVAKAKSAARKERKAALKAPAENDIHDHAMILWYPVYVLCAITFVCIQRCATAYNCIYTYYIIYIYIYTQLYTDILR